MSVPGSQSRAVIEPERWVEMPQGRVALFHRAGRGLPVVYVHGATFPTALSVGWDFGRAVDPVPSSERGKEAGSWMQDLASAGLDVYSFDFLGYGASSRWPAASEPVGRVGAAAAQLAAVVDAVRNEAGVARVGLLAHSWGTLVAGRFASHWPERVARLVLFGPITRRERAGAPGALPPTRDISAQQQWDRFQAEVPAGEAPVFSRDAFEPWAAAYLAADSASGDRVPPTVRVPAGPFADIADAHAGHFPYDPAGVRAPVLLIRGAWDTLATHRDVGWLAEALAGAASVDQVTLSRGTHVMHLESGRGRLWRQASSFLAAGSERR